ncbi:hypothetical protein WME73_45835 [Sorangium sp. So ce302]|uniref:hypothetical protein n=1 Tax=Sorangium sp. So ce302 TaxID=3133297 RepID=UPI003F5EB0C7
MSLSFGQKLAFGLGADLRAAVLLDGSQPGRYSTGNMGVVAGARAGPHGVGSGAARSRDPGSARGGVAGQRAGRQAPSADDAEVEGERKELQAFGQLPRAEADAAWDETWAAARRDGERMLKRTLAVVG